MAKKKKNLGEGGLKSVVLAAAGLLITFSAEAFRSGDITQAAGLGVLALGAYAIHEAMSQYQFAYASGLADMLSQQTDLIEQRENTASDSEPVSDGDNGGGSANDEA